MFDLKFVDQVLKLKGVVLVPLSFTTAKILEAAPNNLDVIETLADAPTAITEVV